MTNPKPLRKRWKTALVAVLVFVAVGWLVAWPAYQRHRAVEEIERGGGEVGRAITGPQWLQKLGIGFDRVVFIDLFRSQVTDETLKHLSRLTSLQVLWLDRTRTTDNGLKLLSRLTNLETLSLGDTAITDNGLKHLSGWTHLRQLSMRNTKITDAGLKHLSGLTNLNLLELDDTEVTGDGVKVLQESLPNCETWR